jgi:flagellar basal-body rod modification protein FlgD
MAVSSVGSVTAGGLDFQSLLKIILTQLTYQDPLKPVDNFEFVSQLAQFSQLQQSQQMSDAMASLLASQSATQATSLLGRKIFLRNGTISGTVTAVTFDSGGPRVTIKNGSDPEVTGISISDIETVQP